MIKAFPLQIRHLRTRLTLMFGGLFCLAILMIGVAGLMSVRAYVQGEIGKEMSATAMAFERIWLEHTRAARTGAALLSRDFGFKTALASLDKATLASALENLKKRLGADTAMVIGRDGQILAGEQPELELAIASRLNTVDIIEVKTGILSVGSQASYVVAAPVLGPDMMGWVVFTTRMDDRELQSIEYLSSVPLKASVSIQSNGIWVAEGDMHPKGRGDARAALDFSDFVAKHLSSRKSGLLDGVTKGTTQRDIVAVAALPNFAGASAAALVLSYPLDKALAPYQGLMWGISLLGLIGLGAVIFASATLASRITRPISDLMQAAQALGEGRTQCVEISGHDEIASLGHAFNRMLATLASREADILRLAKFDQSTGLPNHSAMEDHLIRLGQAQPDLKTLIINVQLEHYRDLRAVWGVKVTNDAMRALAGKLKQAWSESFVARLGNDRLGLVFPIDAEQSVTGLVERISAFSSGHIEVGDHELDLRTRLGYCQCRAGDARPSELMEQAHTALDQARAKSIPICEFDPGIFEEMAERVRLRNELDKALAAEGLEVYYQPKYNLRTRAVDSCEALVRWNHPERGMVPPDRFVALAESSGAILDLTRLVLSRVIMDQRRLAEAETLIDFSVNYSGALVTNTAFNAEVRSLCRAAVGQICLEITETAVIHDVKAGMAALNSFRDAGIEISIDDFGTGLSSLSYLKMIPAHELKIDRAFVAHMEEDTKDALMVRSVINLAHGLGMKVTAEGVETHHGLAMLAALGCDQAQGYVIARPMPFNALLEWIRARTVEGGEVTLVTVAPPEMKKA